MNLKRHIISIGLILSAWLSPLLSQEYLAIVCAGDTGMSYFVKGTEGSTFDWTVNGGTIVRDYGDSIIVDWGVVPGEYELVVQEISEYGCYSVPKTGTILVSAPSIDLGDDTYICEGETFTLEPIGPYYSFEWSDGSTMGSFVTGEEGTISCRVSDVYGCFWEDEIYLEVKPLPEVDLGNDTSLCGEQSLFLNAGYEGVEFEWFNGEVSQEILVYQGFKEVWVKVTDEFGCKNADTLVVEKCDPSVFFKGIPTAFTPNGDGRNDVWRIEKLEAYSDAVIDIYDRWGRLVFKSEPGYPTPWDGLDMNGDEVPMDSYHYVILLNFGEDDRVVGAVTVIK